MTSHNRLTKKPPQRAPLQRSLVNAAPVNAGPVAVPSHVDAAPSWQRMTADPANLRPQDFRTLQARAGNQAVQRLLAQGGLAPDAQERTADAVANQTSGAALRSKQGVPRPQKEGGGEQVGQPVTKSPVQHKAAPGGQDNAPVAPEIAQAIQHAPGGVPLNKNLREQMGASMGQDFSNVRVHTDTRADVLARSMEARAFTTGSDIFFKQGEYNPTSAGGEHLMAHELAHVAQQQGGMQSAQTLVQRKSDKLPQKQDLRNLAKAGFKLFGTSLYGKILNAVDTYHTTVPNTDYLAQLNQLISIHSLLNQWQVSHGVADTTTGSKNKAEGKRRDVLHTLRTTHLPGETADVYQQAKTAGVAVDVHTLMALLDIMAGNPGLGGTIEQDYAAALHGYTAGAGDVTQAQNVLEGPDSTLFDMARGLDSALSSARGMDTDPSGGRISANVMDQPISPHDSDTLKKIKKERAKRRALVPALQNMSDMEIKSIGSYTDESGYTEMNSLLRGSMAQIRGGNKSDRKNNLKFRQEVAQAMLMATSALNRLPDWDGSPVYRGEDISWAGGSIRQGANITLRAFTSTSANRTIASSMATGTESAVWEIDGVRQQGKDISSLTVQAKGDYLGINQGASATEDEILLRPFTTLHIDSIDDNHGQGTFKWLIQAHAV